MLADSVRPLGHKNFALVWGSALISNVGTWMQLVAVGSLVTTTTGQARWAGIVSAAAVLPMGVLTPLGGVVADRLDRRKWLMAITTVELLLAAMLAALSVGDDPAPSLVAFVVFVGGVAAALGIPAHQAILPDLVQPKDLTAAISLSSIQFNLGRVVGPALAGLVIALGGYTWAFGSNALSFAVVIVALCLIRLPATSRGSDDPPSFWEQLANGARGAINESGCRIAIALIAIVGLSVSPFIALIPAVAVNVFDGGSSGTALLTTAQGVGAVVGALALPLMVRRLGRRKVTLAAGGLVTALLICYALSPTIAIAAGIIVVLGGTYIMLITTLNTAVQARAPGNLRGRILGIYMMVFTASFALGSVLHGEVADHIGPRSITVVAAIAFSITLVVALTLRARILHPLDEPEPEQDDAHLVAVTPTPTMTEVKD